MQKLRTGSNRNYRINPKRATEEKNRGAGNTKTNKT